MSNYLSKYKCLNGFTLKLIAIISMFIDHIGAVFFGEYIIFRIVGRLAFPIFCFLLVIGFIYTSNRFKYGMRLFLFAIISEIPFDLAFYNRFVYLKHQNVFFTLLLGLILMCILDKMKEKPITGNVVINLTFQFLAIIVVGILASFLGCDYGFPGILIILAFYIFYYNVGMMILLVIYINAGILGGIQTFAVTALLPILMYNNKEGCKKYKYWFYIFYPAHLVLIFLLNSIINTFL